MSSAGQAVVCEFCGENPANILDKNSGKWLCFDCSKKHSSGDTEVVSQKGGGGIS